MRVRKKWFDPGEAVAVMMAGIICVGVFGASALPFSIGKYFGWLLLPPVALVALFIALAVLSLFFG